METEVENVIKYLKNKKAGGSNKITNEQFRYEVGGSLTKLLTKFFNKSLHFQTIPVSWKTSDIILMYKNGDKHRTGN